MLGLDRKSKPCHLYHDSIVTIHENPDALDEVGLNMLVGQPDFALLPMERENY